MTLGQVEREREGGEQKRVEGREGGRKRRRRREGGRLAPPGSPFSPHIF